MTPVLFFTLAGYALGTCHGARLAERLSGVDAEAAPDHNPGAANVFKTIGPAAGIAVAVFDVLKAAVPVGLYGALYGWAQLPAAVVIAAPVVGHAFSPGGRGGKGIAAAFGVSLGLLPETLPLLALAALYVFFSLVLVVRPHAVRSVLVFAVWAGLLLFYTPPAVAGGALITACVVITRHLMAGEDGVFSLTLFGRLRLYPVFRIN